MKRNRPTKKRSDWVYAVVNNTKGRISMSFDHEKGSIKFDEMVPGTSKVVRSYDRTSGKEKVVMEIPTADGEASFSASRSLKNNFDYLLAIDTGTRQIGDTWVSATVAYGVPGLLSSHVDEVEFVFIRGYLKARNGLEKDNEEFGWNRVLESLNPVHFTSARRLGVVVDSRLGDLRAINERNVPFFRGQYLPGHATLIYASDAMADGLPNQMIRYCDSGATAVLNEVASGRITLPPSAYSDAVRFDVGQPRAS